jgi:Flp pilus assembly protein TadG
VDICPEFVVRLRLLSCFKHLTRSVGTVGARLLSSRQGNFGLTFAMVSVPILLGLGVSIDYVRAYNVRVKMQADLDAALIAAVKRVDSLDESQIKTAVANWFAAQANDEQATYKLLVDTMVISKTNKTINAVATGTVPTTFLGIANIKSVNVSVTTSVAGPATSYLNVYLVLDKSASMLLAATTTGQASLVAKTGCAFACHEKEGGPWTYSSKSYNTHYKVAKAMGIQLRADVSVTAAKEVLTMIAESDPTQSRIKVGLYTIGSDATEALEPTYSTSDAEKALDKDSSGLNSATSEIASYFDTSIDSLTDMVGEAGDGKTAGAPLKLVLMLTDGVQSERNWVLYYEKPNRDMISWKAQPAMSASTQQAIWKYVAPLNPSWCGAMKTNKVTVGVLYTEYLSLAGDWGYEATVGQTMATSKWTTGWGGTLHDGVSSSTKRRDYIPYALQDCASSKDMFISAADPDAIEAGLSTLFQQYLGSVRLTQ